MTAEVKRPRGRPRGTTRTAIRVVVGPDDQLPIAAIGYGKFRTDLDERFQRLRDELIAAHPRYANIDELGRILSVTPRTLQTLLAQGLPSFKIGDSRRFEVAEVVKWCREQVQKESAA